MNKLYKFINGKRVKALKDKECYTCKKLFSPRASEDKYCCRECYYEMKRIRKDRVVWTDEMRESLSKRYTGNGNPAWGKKGWSKGKKRWDISGDKHWKWGGGKSKNIQGYIVVQNNFDTNGERIPEHRVVYEKQVNSIPSGFIVHHKNGDKTDNNPNNLEVMSRADHINLHRDELLLACEIGELVFRNVEEACLFFGISKSAFYRRRKKGVICQS